MVGLIVLLFLTIVLFSRLYVTFGKNKYCNTQEEVKIKNAIESLMKNNQNKELTKRYVINSSLSDKVLEIKTILPDFVPEVFLKQAEKDFNNIFTAFTSSQHKILKEKLTDTLYEDFSFQIQKREEQNLRQNLNIEYKQTVLEDIGINNNTIQILVIFNVKQMSAMVDINGKSLDNPHKISRNVQHKWLFEYINNQWIIIKINAKETN